MLARRALRLKGGCGEEKLKRGMRLVFANLTGEFQRQRGDRFRVVRFEAVIVRRAAALAIHAVPNAVACWQRSPADSFP